MRFQREALRRPFGKADFARMPACAAAPAPGSLPAASLAALALLAFGAALLGMRRLDKAA